MLPILIKLAEAWGDPYTVRKAFMDVLSVMFLLAIEFFIFINAGVILHSPSIQQGDEWGKPAIYSATFIVMCLVLAGYLALMNRVELIIINRRKSCSKK
mgnify:FL=1